jgi:hypothetical protein
MASIDPVVTLVIGAAATLVAVLAVRRITDPGPLARGNADWRWRERGPDRRRAVVRSLIVYLELGIAVVFVGLVIAFAVHALLWDHDLRLRDRALLLLPAGVAYLGLVWMWRIAAAARDLGSDPAWRYRARE